MSDSIPLAYPFIHRFRNVLLAALFCFLIYYLVGSGITMKAFQWEA